MRNYVRRSLGQNEVEEYEYPLNLYLDMFVFLQPDEKKLDPTKLCSTGGIPWDANRAIEEAFQMYIKYARSNTSTTRNIWIVLCKYQYNWSYEEIMDKYSLRRDSVVRICRSVLKQMENLCRELLLLGWEKHNELTNKREKTFKDDIEVFRYIQNKSILPSTLYSPYKRLGIHTLKQILEMRLSDFVEHSKCSKYHFDKVLVELASFGISYDYYADQFIIISHNYIYPEQQRHSILEYIYDENLEKMKDVPIDNLIFVSDVMTLRELELIKSNGLDTLHDLWTSGFYGEIVPSLMRTERIRRKIIKSISDNSKMFVAQSKEHFRMDLPYPQNLYTVMLKDDIENIDDVFPVEDIPNDYESTLVWLFTKAFTHEALCYIRILFKDKMSMSQIEDMFDGNLHHIVSLVSDIFKEIRQCDNIVKILSIGIEKRMEEYQQDHYGDIDFSQIPMDYQK